MPSIKIDDKDLASPSRETLDALAEGWNPAKIDDPGLSPMIEDIYGALRKTYTHDELYQLDAEFLLQEICREWGVLREDLDDLFIEKLYGVLAIVLNPIEVTQDLSAFINTTLLANDQNTVPGDGELVPSRFIPRMIDAVNKILPDDQDFHEVFWQDDITKFIIECYKSESNYLLDDALAYMTDTYLDSWMTVTQAEPLKDTAKTLRKWVQELFDIMPEATFQTDKGIDAAVENIADQIRKNTPAEIQNDEYAMTMLGKYMVNTLYVRLYRDLRMLGINQKI